MDKIFIDKLGNLPKSVTQEFQKIVLPGDKSIK